MIRILSLLFLLLIPCSSVVAEDLPTIRLVALCFYDVASEVCHLPIGADDRKRLDSAKTKVHCLNDQSVSAAAEVCSQLKRDAQSRAESFCTPQLKAYFYSTLKSISDE